MGTIGDDRRAHTGRKRNEAARQAVLDAAADLLGRSDGMSVTIDTIAQAARVGRQTIYRWWPSKGAVLLAAMVARAQTAAPGTDTGTLLGDLTAFLTATFHAASDKQTAPLLRAVMAEAQQDPHAAGVMREFTGRRRAALREILDRGQTRGELPADADLDLMVDQAYGVLWYRILIGHAPLTDKVAGRLANALISQAEVER